MNDTGEITDIICIAKDMTGYARIGDESARKTERS